MEDLQKLTDTTLEDVKQAANLSALEDIRINCLGKKGIISQQLRQLGSMSEEERKSFGQSINIIKHDISNAIDQRKEELNQAAIDQRIAQEKADVTLPIREEKHGSIHPISQVIDEIVTIFASMGFTLEEGAEIEDDFHNFTALNIPLHHPAREMQDTFYLPNDQDGKPIVLRTHTSSVQIRTMEKQKPPYRFIAAGRVYRSDYDMTHTPMFHQVEGLYIDKDIHMGHLKGCLTEFLKTFFELDELPMQFRGSYFPFTEPSAEVDIGYGLKNGQITIGAGDKWLEILGCCMVHPNVLRNVNMF